MILKIVITDDDDDDDCLNNKEDEDVGETSYPLYELQSTLTSH